MNILISKMRKKVNRKIKKFNYKITWYSKIKTQSCKGLFIIDKINFQKFHPHQLQHPPNMTNIFLHLRLLTAEIITKYR